MADAVVSFLLNKLSTLIAQKYTQLVGLETDVRYINDELQSMVGSLVNAEAKQDYGGILDPEQQAWIIQMRDAAYDMEDVVDEFLLHFAHRGSGAGFCGYISDMFNPLKNLRARDEITSKIRDIRVRVKEIADRHDRYKSSQGIVERTTSRQHPIRVQALFLKEDDLVGIKEPKLEIISLILNHTSPLNAISVVGMGGLGKTTLVKRVYDDTDVKNTFPIHAWLTIPHIFSIELVLKDLINQIKKLTPIEMKAIDAMDADGLRPFVRNLLKEERYIIVLDGLGEMGDWNSIYCVFPDDDNYGNCILITTRDEHVANACCKQFRGNVYRMMKLSMDDSWKLFCRKTFEEDRFPPHLKSIANKILSKCDGLPLGITLIGGLLALKPQSEWDMVLGSIGSELEGKLTPIRKILFLNYNELPNYLKSCLLYMGIFFEHEIVDIEELAFLWIAEGFVKVEKSDGITAMKVALSYLNELICRSLIQVGRTELDGRLRSCRVHDLIYEIILSKCKEHNILTPAITSNTAWPEKVRRLRVDDSTCPKNPFPLLHLRSLFRHKFLSDSSLSILLHGNPKLLKVLDLQYANICIIPKKVFKLLNLTYLNLSHTNITNIPKSIRKLQNLEYLNIEYSGVEDLPADIIKLNKLCCLYVPHFNSISPNICGRLNSLQYLRRINAYTKEAIREIGKLTQLRELHISCNGRELGSSLQELTNLERLMIEFHENENEIVDMTCSFSERVPLTFLYYLNLVGPLVKVPNWVTSCNHISTLYLSHSRLKEDPLETLANLPNLVMLSLYDDECVGNTLHFKAGGFQKLKSLRLRRLPLLKSVIFAEGTLSDLETLQIQECKSMEEMPPGIPYLRKLKNEFYSKNGWSP